jgi:hypothetical protein
VRKRMDRRLPGVKVFGSGFDPCGAFLEFLEKDLVRNIDVHRDFVKRRDHLDGRTGKVAVGCTKILRKREKKEGEGEKREKVNYVLKTDHISYQVPVSHSHDQLQVTRYCKSNVSNNSWQPARALSSFSNYHSSSFNIISHQPSPTKKPSEVYVGLQKGIDEFSHLTSAFHPHVNEDYHKALKEDPKVFYKKTGIFSHMYDAAGRHGFMIMPFEKSVQKSKASKLNL